MATADRHCGVRWTSNKIPSKWRCLLQIHIFSTFSRGKLNRPALASRRDCVTIIRRGAKANRRWGLSIKNNTKIAGLKLKLLSLQGGPNFHFMSCAFALNCKNNFSCIVKQEIYCQLLNNLRKCEVYIKKIYHLILDMLGPGYY